MEFPAHCAQSALDGHVQCLLMWLLVESEQLHLAHIV